MLFSPCPISAATAAAPLYTPSLLLLLLLPLPLLLPRPLLLLHLLLLV
jgi:hypothetical protein